MHHNNIKGSWINFNQRKCYNVRVGGVWSLEIEVEMIAKKDIIIVKLTFRLIHTRDCLPIKVKEDAITIKANFPTEIKGDRRAVQGKYW